jgi:hypothetical protein
MQVRPHRRLFVILGVVAVVLVGGGVTLWVLWHRSSARPVTRAEAIRRFHPLQGGNGGPARPAQGVRVPGYGARGVVGPTQVAGPGSDDPRDGDVARRRMLGLPGRLLDQPLADVELLPTRGAARGARRPDVPALGPRLHPGPQHVDLHVRPAVGRDPSGHARRRRVAAVVLRLVDGYEGDGHVTGAVPLRRRGDDDDRQPARAGVPLPPVAHVDGRAARNPDRGSTVRTNSVVGTVTYTEQGTFEIADLTPTGA